MIVTLSKYEVTCLGDTVKEKEQKEEMFKNLCKHRNIEVHDGSATYTLVGLKDDNELELILKLTDEI